MDDPLYWDMKEVFEIVRDDLRGVLKFYGYPGGDLFRPQELIDGGEWLTDQGRRISRSSEMTSRKIGAGHLLVALGHYFTAKGFADSSKERKDETGQQHWAGEVRHYAEYVLEVARSRYITYLSDQEARPLAAILERCNVPPSPPVATVLPADKKKKTPQPERLRRCREEAIRWLSDNPSQKLQPAARHCTAWWEEQSGEKVGEGTMSRDLSGLISELRARAS